MTNLPLFNPAVALSVQLVQPARLYLLYCEYPEDEIWKQFKNVPDLTAAFADEVSQNHVWANTVEDYFENRPISNLVMNWP